MDVACSKQAIATIVYVVLTLGFIGSFRIKAFHEIFLMLGLNMAIVLYNHNLVAPHCISEAADIVGWCLC